jgi:diacylglycerol O-acyltransferase / wax synthase
MTAHFDEWLSDSDTLMWTIEKDPILRSTIVAVALLDTVPDPDRVRSSLEHASVKVPRLRQVVEVPPLRLGPPRWVTDPRFELDHHLRWIRLSERGPQRTVLDVAAQAASAAFDKNRPLWELTVVEDAAGGAALVLKVHHSLTDGVGGIEMAAHIFDFERHPVPKRSRPETVAQPSRRVDLARAAAAEQTRQDLRRGERYARAAIGTAGAAMADPMGTARRAADVARTAGRLVAPVAEVLSPVMRERSINRALLTADVPLHALKAAGRAAGCTVNDAYLAVVTGALRRYHEGLGQPVEQLRVMMPVNLRVDGDGAAGNRFTPARFPLPVGIADPAERMRAIDALARQWATDPNLDVSDDLAALLNRLPSSFTTEFFGGMLKKIDFVATNVPGSPVPMYLGGAEVTRVYPFAPPGGSSLAFGLLSHVGTCCIGICCDTAAVTDLGLLARCVDEALAEVLALAGDAAPSADASPTPVSAAPGAAVRDAKGAGDGADGAKPAGRTTAGARAAGARAAGAKANGAKANGAKANGAKANGAKANGAKAAGATAPGSRSNGARTRASTASASVPSVSPDPAAS